jgi:drug/metabolite transporter (DMT)-like permease
LELSTQALLLILASAFLHALWNAILKKEEDAQVAVIGVLAIASGAAVVASLFAKAPAFPRPLGIAWAGAAGICEAGYFVTLCIALLRAPLGQVYSVSRGVAIIAVWPISVALLGERVTLGSLLGMSLLSVGVWAVGSELSEVWRVTFSKGRNSPHLTEQGGAAGRGLLWAAGCALFIAGYHLCYKLALQQQAEPRALFAVSVSIALPLNILYLGRQRTLQLWPLIRARPIQVLAAGILCTASFLLALEALSFTGAGAVLTLRNTSVLFAQALAFAIGERIGARQVGGAILVALGATVMGWPR